MAHGSGATRPLPPTALKPLQGISTAVCAGESQGAALGPGAGEGRYYFQHARPLCLAFARGCPVLISAVLLPGVEVDFLAHAEELELKVNFAYPDRPTDVAALCPAGIVVGFFRDGCPGLTSR
eukprot:2600045-Rhodomonas_salina.1